MKTPLRGLILCPSFAQISLAPRYIFHIETVAALLGNTVKVCEKHYAPWIESRQLALEAAVRQAWD